MTMAGVLWERWQMADETNDLPDAAPAPLFHLMTQVHRRRQARLEGRLAQEGLNMIRWQTLALIRRMPGCAMSDVALHTAVDRTTLTRVVDRLEEHGLVERRAARHDRRQASLEVTARGRAVCDRAERLVAEDDARLLARLAPGEMARAVRVLEELAGALAGDRARDVLAYAARLRAPMRPRT
jgi:MarR family transcriptional regulator for hemolysin